MLKYALSICLLLIVSTAHAADTAKQTPVAAPPAPPPSRPVWQQEYDQLSAEPGAKISTTNNTDGSVTHSVTLAGPVTVTYTIAKDGKVTTTGEDDSGHGAVLCAWNLYTGLRGTLEVCPQKDKNDAELKNLLDQVIDHIDNFIVENQIPRTSKAMLQSMADNQLKRAQTRIASMPADKRAKICAGDASQMLDQIKAMPIDEFKKSIDDILTIPRLPVMQPCL